MKIKLAFRHARPAPGPIKIDGQVVAIIRSTKQVGDHWEAWVEISVRSFGVAIEATLEHDQRAVA